MQLITENGLDTWVRGNAKLAQGIIVELIARLVFASSPKPTDRRFPLGDAIGQHGPDGYLDAIIAHDPYVPKGKSYWEIGTGGDSKKKCNDDYDSLIKTLDENIRKESTFIFVTPLSGAKDWAYTPKANGQIAWVEEKKNSGEWKDVRVIDGTKLVDWVHEFVAIELWLADKTGGLNPNNVTTVEQKWDLIKSIGEPPSLSTGLFLSNRADCCQKISEHIDSENTFRLKLMTHFPSEVSYFVSAYISSLSEDKKHEISNRTVLVSGEDAWNSLCNRNENLILVADSNLDLNGDNGTLLLQKAKKKNHSVVFGGPKGGIPDPSSIMLAAPRSHHVEEELKKTGYNDERARILALKSNGNLVHLLKYIQNLSVLPDWAQNTQGADLKMIALLGSWNESSEQDKAAVEKIVGKPYGEWITKIRSASSQPATPLTFRDGKWKLISRYETWYALGSHLSDDDLDRFQKNVIPLLKQKDPKFELDKEQRYAAQIYGKFSPYSKGLKNGLADTIALFGSQSQALTQCSENKSEFVANIIVRNVLEGADWQLWATLNEILPLLAEAAPNEFLAALESELLKENCAFIDLFNQEGNGITGGIYTTGILWGLETLAWDINYLSRVTLTLGLLASKDPGGQWTNRPSNSLRNLFLPWYPQTTAPMDKRILAVKALVKELPDVAWKLILQLLPGHYSSTSGAHKPSWRSSIPDDWKKGVTNKEYWEQVTEYSKIAIEMAKGNKTKIAELVDRLDDLPKDFHDVFLGQLNSDEFISTPEEQRAEVWDALMNVIGKHRRFPDADWALPKEAVDRIAETAKKIAPQEPEYLYKRNFANRTYDDLTDTGNYDSQMKAIAQKQESAILQIYNSGGMKKIRNFIPTVDMPYNIGRALGVVGPEQIDSEILPNWLDEEDRNIVSFTASYVLSRFHSSGWTWVNKVIQNAWTKEQIGKLFSHLPFTKDTWNEAKKNLGEDESIYWKIANVNPYLEKEDLETGIKKLLDNGRPNAAIDCLQKLVWEKNTPEPTLVVKALLDSLSSNEPINSRDGYQIVQIIKNLQENPNTSPNDLFKVEWAYLQLLERDNEASPITLEKRLSEDPLFFCEVIQLVFKSKKDSGKEKKSANDEATQNIATNAYHLLNHWSTPPGSKEDGTFDVNFLNEWLKTVKDIVTESGHLEVAYLMIGHVLTHAPIDKGSGLWIHEGVAEVLNATDAQEMRNGFRTATFNSRGVFWGSGGKEELALSEAYKAKAQSLEDKGFVRFATTLRGLSDSYKKESERAASEDHFDD